MEHNEAGNSREYLYLMWLHKLPIGIDVGHTFLPKCQPVAPVQGADVVLDRFCHGLPVMFHWKTTRAKVHSEGFVAGVSFVFETGCFSAAQSGLELLVLLPPGIMCALSHTGRLCVTTHEPHQWFKDLCLLCFLPLYITTRGRRDRSSEKKKAESHTEVHTPHGNAHHAKEAPLSGSTSQKPFLHHGACFPHPTELDEVLGLRQTWSGVEHCITLKSQCKKFTIQALLLMSIFL